MVDSNGSNLNIVDWQGNVVSIAILLPTSLALSVITVIKVNILITRERVFILRFHYLFIRIDMYYFRRSFLSISVT